MTISGQFLADHLWHLGSMLVLLGFSGFFSGTETALFSLSRGQLHRMRQSGVAGGLVASLMARPENVLNTLLLGNTLVNVAYAGITAIAVYDLRRSGADVWIVSAALLGPLVVLILMGEVGPKTIAYVYRQRWASLAASPLVIIRRVLAPILHLFNALLIGPLTKIVAPAREPSDIRADELAALLDLSAKRGIIGHDASELLQEILELPDLRVSNIMVPRVDMITFNVAGQKDELIELFGESRLRKIPVYDGSPDNIIGVVHFKRLLLEAPEDLRQLVVAVPFVPEAANIERLLMQFRDTQTQMAIVVDEYGGTAGLVTVEDVLEEIVGDIRDPHEVRLAGPAVKQVGPGEYVIEGDLAIHEWSEAFKTDLTGKRISTIGGFVVSLLGRIPSSGDTVTYRNLRFTVMGMRKHRVSKLRLELGQEAT